MNRLIVLIVFTLIAGENVHAHSQVDHLKKEYSSQKDSFFVTLYWLPETRQIVIKHIPDHGNWVGFEMGYWKQLTEEEKMLVLQEIGEEFDRLKSTKLRETWRRILEWQRIKSQLDLLAAFLGRDEGFLDLAYDDPVLRPAFNWLIDRRGAGFDTKYIRSSFTSGERAHFEPLLVTHLLDTPEQQRFECFSRLFARLAEIERSETEANAE